MSDFSKAIQQDTKNLSLDIDRLAELVESQITNVIGGGYSQYAAYHNKDAPTSGPGSQ